MYRILIMTYPEAAIGYRLSGADVLEFKEDEAITSSLEEIFKKKDYGLLAVEEGMLKNVPEDLMKKIAREGIPVVVPINTPKGWYGAETAESYIARIIRKAIGYEVKIKR